MPTRVPLAQQESRRRTHPAQPTQPVAQSRRPAPEPLVNGTLAADVERYPGPQEHHRQEQEQQLGQEEQGHQDQDQDDVQIVEPPQEVRNW